MFSRVVCAPATGFAIVRRRGWSQGQPLPEEKKEEGSPFKLADSVNFARKDRAVPKHPALRKAAGDDSVWF